MTVVKMTELEQAVKILGEGYTCVLVGGEEIITSTGRGVSPIVSLIEDGKNLQKFAVADKLVGKAVALLLAFAGVKSVYADTLSESAIPVLKSYGVTYSFRVLTERIINREGTDICPMEKTVENIDDPLTAYEAIRQTLSKLKAKADG